MRPLNIASHRTEHFVQVYMITCCETFCIFEAVKHFVYLKHDQVDQKAESPCEESRYHRSSQADQQTVTVAIKSLPLIVCVWQCGWRIVLRSRPYTKARRVSVPYSCSRLHTGKNMVTQYRGERHPQGHQYSIVVLWSRSRIMFGICDD